MAFRAAEVAGSGKCPSLCPQGKLCSAEGLENCKAFHIFTLKPKCWQKWNSCEAICSPYLSCLENINEFEYRVLPQAPSGVFIIHDLCLYKIWENLNSETCLTPRASSRRSEAIMETPRHEAHVEAKAPHWLQGFSLP